MAEKIYIIFLIVSYFFSGIKLIQDNKYYIEEVLYIGVIVALGFFYTLFLYRRIRKDTYARNRFVFNVNYRRFNNFMIIYLVIMILYGIRTGDGAAEAGGLFSSSIFASLWVPDSIFPLYYCVCREKYKIRARIVAVLYVLYKIFLGWSGVVLFIAVLELYYVYKDRKIDSTKTILITIVAYIFGGGLYGVLHPLKYSIRFGTSFNISDRLSIMEGISNLANRIAHLESTLYVHENIDKVINLYQSQGIIFPEFMAIFRPLIPSFIMKNKIFSSIGSCIYNAQSGYSGINITNNVGILYYYKLLLKCDAISFVLCIFTFLIFLCLLKKVYNCFQIQKGQFDILYFWILVQGYSICGTIENCLSNSYIKIVFFIPLFWVLGIIKVYKNSNLFEDSLLVE